MARKRSRRARPRASARLGAAAPTRTASTRRGRTLVLAAAALALLLAIGALLRQSPGDAVVSSGAGEVFPIGVELPGSARVESLLAAVDPRRDGWKTEAVNEELEAALKEIGDALRHGEPSALLGRLAGSFRATPLDPASSSPRSASPDVELLELVYGGETSLDRESFSAALQVWRERLEEIDHVKFKVVGIELAGTEETAARTRVLLELRGRGAEGALLAVRADGRLAWLRESEGWKISEMALERATLARAPRAAFVDVSALAFAGDDAFPRQMALGINDFRARLDAASGIDVFGHNGVSIVDADGDGLEDLFVAQPAGLPNRMYRNRGDGTFEDVSRDAGVDVLDRTSMGLFADFDDDGDDDLALILQNETPVLFDNDGRGAFTPSPSARFERKDGARATHTSAAAADYDGDGDLDLYVCSYLVVDAPGADKALPIPSPYHDARNGAANVLYRNLGEGRFEDVTVESGLDSGNDRFSFAASWSDYDGDGRPDLYVANDFGRNNLYRNEGGGRFRDVSAEAGVEDLGAGMSVAWADVDADGLDDLYVGNMWSSAGQRLTRLPGYQSALAASYARHAKGNTLFRNRGDGGFDDATDAAGVALGRWSWASDFFDADNDGDEDLYIANGYITNRSDRDL